MKQQEKQSRGKIAIVAVSSFSAQGEVIFTKTITWRTRTCLLRRSRFCYYRPLFTQLFTSYVQREDPEIYCTPFFFSSNRTMVPHGSVVCSLSIPVLRNPILFEFPSQSLATAFKRKFSNFSKWPIFLFKKAVASEWHQISKKYGISE